MDFLVRREVENLILSRKCEEMDAITYKEVCDHLDETMDKVVDNHSPVIITRPHNPPVVLISLDDYNSWRETEYLTRSPANAKDLQKAVEEINNHRNLMKRELIEE